MCILQQDPTLPYYEWKITKDKVYFNMNTASFETNRYIEYKLNKMLKDKTLIGDKQRDPIIIKTLLLNMVTDGKIIEYPFGTRSLDLYKVGILK